MDKKTARALSDLTTNFYEQVHDSFDATRQAPWQGWDEVVRVARGCGLPAEGRLRVLDLACGNLRFERYLRDLGYKVEARAYDNCDELVGAGEGVGSDVAFHHVDLAGALFEGGLGEVLDAPACDMAVCFGFMHHVPLESQRCQLLSALADAVRPGGVVAVSFWQFARSARLMAKAVSVESGDTGDYLLGWQGRSDVRRYCHSFEEAEIDELVGACGSQVMELARFSADGKTGDMNRYLILRRN